jgi:hypothetical protein
MWLLQQPNTAFWNSWSVLLDGELERVPIAHNRLARAMVGEQDDKDRMFWRCPCLQAHSHAISQVCSCVLRLGGIFAQANLQRARQERRPRPRARCHRGLAKPCLGRHRGDDARPTFQSAPATSWSNSTSLPPPSHTSLLITQLFFLRRGGQHGATLPTRSRSASVQLFSLRSFVNSWVWFVHVGRQAGRQAPFWSC